MKKLIFKIIIIISVIKILKARGQSLFIILFKLKTRTQLETLIIISKIFKINATICKIIRLSMNRLRLTKKKKILI